MRRRALRRRTEPPENNGPGALTAAELAEGFVTTMLDYAREAEIDAGDAAAMAALDLICCLAVYGRAPLAAVLDALTKAAPVRLALVKDANKRNQPPPPLGRARREPDQRADQADQGHRGEDLLADVELDGQGDPEQLDIPQRMYRAFE